MQIFSKSFPKLQIFVILCIFFSCRVDETNIIEEKKFTEFYSRLLIIQEMNINDEKHTQLLQKLMNAYQVSEKELARTMQYYQSYPERWVDVLSKIRNQLNELRTKRKPIK